MAAHEGKAQGPKPVVPAGHALNWYFGNFLHSPRNSFRDEEGFEEKARKLEVELRGELKGRKMTHKQFLDLMKKDGIHSAFYCYRKPEPADCPACRLCGVR